MKSWTAWQWFGYAMMAGGVAMWLLTGIVDVCDDDALLKDGSRVQMRGTGRIPMPSTAKGVRYGNTYIKFYILAAMLLGTGTIVTHRESIHLREQRSEKATT